MAKNAGKRFEKDIQDSCKKYDIFFYRIKDSTGAFNKACMNCPENSNKFTPKNEVDLLIFKNSILFPLEMKSTKSKSLSFSKSIIKPQQIKKLTEWTQFKNVIPGFLINFRSNDNKTFFLHIDDFNYYKENPIMKNKSSIPFAYCEQEGIEIEHKLKKVNYTYNIKKFINDVKEKYMDKNNSKLIN